MSDAHMTFGFSEEQRQMRASVLGLLGRVLPQAKIRELDKAGEYPFEACQALADGWFSYAVSPEMFAKGLLTIETEVQRVGRKLDRFGTAHLMFTRIGDSYERALDEAAESLSVRYAMNMRPATERYGAIGTPAQVADKIRAFHSAGVRHLSLDLVGPYERRGEQFERFAAEVRPLIKDLMA